EAEVERLLDLLALPAIPDRLTLKHLAEEVRAAAGRVLLLAEHHEARAHRPAVQAPALADADAAQRRTCEAPLVVRVAEVRHRRRRPVVRAESQVRVPGIRIDDLAGVQQPCGIPDRLEPAARLDPLIAAPAGLQVGPTLAVAVLAGERAAVGDAERGRVLGEGEVLLDPALALEVEVDPCVDAPLSEVAVERAPILVLLEQAAEAAEVAAERLDRHRRV